jgi:hypothetical protein
LQSQDHAKLKHIAGLLAPGLVYVADTGPFAKALAALDLTQAELVASRNGAGLAAVTALDDMAQSRPGAALDDLLEAVPSLDRGEQQAQLKVVLPALAPAPFDFPALRGWARWDREHGLLEDSVAVHRAFVNG